MPHRVDDAAFWEQDIALHVPLYVALAMHGHLCLALRHPGTRDTESRPMVVRAVKRLGQLFVEQGALTSDELAAIERLEAEEGGLQPDEPMDRRAGTERWHGHPSPPGEARGPRC
jgi:hypothetical protein